jgi:hypothetical protein
MTVISIIQGRQPLSSYIVLVSTLNLPEGAAPSCYELLMIDMSCDSTYHGYCTGGMQLLFFCSIECCIFEQ